MIAGLTAMVFSFSALEAGEVEIFNGKNLNGWSSVETKNPQKTEDYWKVVDGVIIGDNPDKKNSVLWTEKEFGDYTLTLEFKTESPDYDSGVFLHGESHQEQIGVSRSLKVDLTACIYAPIDGKGGYPATSDKVKTVHKLGEWNTMKIVVEGKRIRTWMNGEEFVDYTGPKFAEKGPIGLQLHAGVHQKMQFRNLTLTVEG
ncbi:DUF1080 domain-containing protein [Haloferula chungangensis]|uniref:DUF1080 domain-containing protein n=1 Tax=Haloferula chungangensis TaxID=1048331 RepID=A0ABW2L3A4_9BACT